ncbi:MAG: NADP-dependent oxidoreductase, partial [Yaniella sp.]|nr:NADP-dependent oxidoreductase [Yaniella sp.]
MTTSTSTQIHLANRPTGVPTPDNFATVRAELPALADAEVRVQNAFISV